MKALLIFLLTSTMSSGCFAASCDDYPNMAGMAPPEIEQGNIKITSTGSAVVDFDDASAIADARQEATLSAKAYISGFFNETVRSDESVNRAVQSSKTMQGDSKATTRKEVVERLRQLSSSSQALLKGVVVIGECYTKGREYRVTVGVKPETLAAAEDTAGRMSQPVGKSGGSPGKGSSERGSTDQKLDGMEGFSRTETLKRF